ncbi:hypothetical protein [Desulfuribacillus alkaliarsenatis]|uniref:Uncharacterized protein n=1 Tax=Desulfuribacillus alkaliarsenatis TaxID=766136 RepID=A0A1E5FZ93_9FIRM|nr:hypothetical protein [Desulfuribacillus alkaliarsenatis]OEF95891.1 hypothetical protein BHF68_10895 [Desulfuribacillus alkaliarsenatis]
MFNKQTRLILALAIILSMFTLSACGGLGDSQGNREQAGANDSGANENIIEPKSDTEISSASDVNIKIYKDYGDAVDAFFLASENNIPIFLYFYTDT